MTRRCFSTLQRCAISGKMKSTEISSINVAAFQTQPLLPIGCCGYKVPLQGFSCPSLAMSREYDWLAARNTSCKPSELQRLVPSPTKINRASQDFGHMGHPVAPLPGSSICLVGAAVVVSRYRLLSFRHHSHYKTPRPPSCKIFHSFDIFLWCCRPDTGFSM